MKPFCLFNSLQRLCFLSTAPQATALRVVAGTQGRQGGGLGARLRRIESQHTKTCDTDEGEEGGCHVLNHGSVLLHVRLQSNSVAVFKLSCHTLPAWCCVPA